MITYMTDDTTDLQETNPSNQDQSLTKNPAWCSVDREKVYKSL